MVDGLELKAAVEPVVDGVAVDVNRGRQLVAKPARVGISGVAVDDV